MNINTTSSNPINRGALRRRRQRLEALRGVMAACRRCPRRCKVLRGSPGTSARFWCFDRLTGRGNERRTA